MLVGAKNIGLKVLTGHGAAIDTTTSAGKLVFGIFAALSEFEREMIKERTIAYDFSTCAWTKRWVPL
jgi:DNA invertase Pin-like site-specific DNA recombinase